MGTHFSKRGGHHSGVMTGHEVMVYTFMSGTQCQPKRRKFARSSKRYSRSSINLGRDHKTLSVQKLSRSPSPASVRLRKVNNYNTRASLDLDLVRGEERILDSYSRGVENGSGNNHGNANIEIEISSLESNSEVITCHCLHCQQTNHGLARLRLGKQRTTNFHFLFFYSNFLSMQSSYLLPIIQSGRGAKHDNLTLFS